MGSEGSEQGNSTAASQLEGGSPALHTPGAQSSALAWRVSHGDPKQVLGG